MDKHASLAERLAYNEGLEAAAQLIERSRGARILSICAEIRAAKGREVNPLVKEVLDLQVSVEYPPIEEVLELRPPQAEVLRRMPDQVADTMDRAQLAAWGKHD